MVGRDKARCQRSATTSTTPWSRLAEVTAFCSSIAHPVASAYLGRKSFAMIQSAPFPHRPLARNPSLTERR